MPNYSGGATGALGGAGTGAAVGSLFPGPGTAIGAGVGAVVGGVGGLFSGGGGGGGFTDDPYAFMPYGYGQLAQQYGQRQSPFISEGNYGAPSMSYHNVPGAQMGTPPPPPPPAPGQQQSGSYLGGNYQGSTLSSLSPNGQISFGQPYNGPSYGAMNAQANNMMSGFGGRLQAANPGQGSGLPAGSTFGSYGSVPGLANQQMYAQLGQAGQQAQSGDPSFRYYQSQLSGDLMNQSRGIGPSLADQVFANAADKNLRQQISMAAGARGNHNLAMRNASLNGSQFFSDTAGQAAAARLAERQQAQGLLGQVAGQGRTGDINVAQGNQNAALQQQQLNQQAQLRALEQQQQGMQSYQAARMGVPSQSDKILTGVTNLADNYLKTRKNNPGTSTTPPPANNIPPAPSFQQLNPYNQGGNV